MLFWVSSLVGIVLLPVLLERGMFYEQFRCNIMIDWYFSTKYSCVYSQGVLMHEFI